MSITRILHILWERGATRSSSSRPRTSRLRGTVPPILTLGAFVFGMSWPKLAARTAVGSCCPRPGREQLRGRVWAGWGWWWDLTTLPWVQKELEERARRPPLHHPSHPRCCVWGGWHGHGRGCARGRFRVPAGWHGHGRRRVCGEVCRWYFPLVAYEVVLKRVTLIRHTRNSCRSFEFIKRHTQIMRSDTPGTVCCF